MGRHRPDPAAPVGAPLADPSQTAFLDTVDFSRDGHTLATASGGGVLLWDVTEPDRARPLGPALTEQVGTASAVAFSPVADLMVTGGSGGSGATAILWDVGDPARPRAVGPPLATDDASVISVAFTRDGATMITGGLTDPAVVWDVSDPGRPRRLAPPLKAADVLGWAVAVTPDGAALLTAGATGDAVVWDMRPLAALRADPLTRACRITGGGLTREEWARYVPVLDYRDPCAG